MRCGPHSSFVVCAAAGLALVLFAQADVASAQVAKTNQTMTEDGSDFRKLAAGVEYTFPISVKPTETTTRKNLIGILNQDAEFGVRADSNNLAEGVDLNHDIWALELTIKPCRLIEVDVPAGNGKFDRKQVWYVWYHVRNTSDKPVRFTPKFMLHLTDIDKHYPDRIIPVAMNPIALREDPNRRMFDSVSISDQEIAPAGQSGDQLWGCACWEDVDPSTDEFSISVQGLTNACQMEAVDAEDGGQKWEYSYKTLEINFRRPGDEFFEHSREVRLGNAEGVEYRWIYQ